MSKRRKASPTNRRHKPSPTKRELAAMIPGSDALNTLEAASFLGVHVETLRKLARVNGIPAFKIGRDWRFRKSALERWLNEQQSTAVQGSAPDSVNDSRLAAPVSSSGREAEALVTSMNAVRRHTDAAEEWPVIPRSSNVGQSHGSDSMAASISDDSLRSVLGGVTLCIQKWLGCDAVAVRLREGLDFPYFETRGFSEEFALAAQHLCARDPMGELLRDSEGDPVLECMCGNVICGRFDPQKPFFTEHGAFWTNSTTELLASTSEEDRQARTRNRCNGAGYESVALVPLRHDTEIVGLLQLNHREKGLFDVEVIGLLERVAESIALVVVQHNTLRLRQKETDHGGRLHHRSSLVVTGRSFLPVESSPTDDPEPIFIEVALDPRTHMVMTAVCEGLPKLAEEMVTRFLLGKTMPFAIRDASDGMSNGYYSDLRRPILAALDDVLRNYRDLAQRTGYRSGDTDASVLIIDDEEKVCHAMSQIIQKLGYDARIALGGREGLEQIALQVPDLVLLDLKMPDMNGPQFLEILRGDHPNLPVVIVTGYPDGDLMTEATRYAPLMLLAKPAEPGQLEQTVRLASWSCPGSVDS